MKKISMIALISLATATYMHAQTISLGVKGGFGDAWVHSDENTADIGFLPSWDAGLSMIYSSDQHIGFGVDLTYSAEGVKYVAPDSLPNADAEINLSYIRLPLKAIYFFGEFEDAVRPKLIVGPEFGLLTAAEVDDIDVTDFYNTLDIGVHFGVGANFKAGEKMWLNADVTYTQGLLDITDDIFTEQNDLNGNLRLNVGLLFGL